MPFTELGNRQDVFVRGGNSIFFKGSLILDMFTLKYLLPVSAPPSTIHCHHSSAGHHLAQPPGVGETVPICTSNSVVPKGQATLCLVIFLKQRSCEVISNFILFYLFILQFNFKSFDSSFEEMLKV